MIDVFALPQWGTVDRAFLEYFFNGRTVYRSHVVAKIFKAISMPAGGTQLRLRDMSRRTPRSEWPLIGEVFPDGYGWIDTSSLPKRRATRLRRMFIRLFNLTTPTYEQKLMGTRKSMRSQYSVPRPTFAHFLQERH